MKKYLLMLVALCSLSFFSCTEKAATDKANADGTKTEQVTEVPQPTGDAEKDAQAVVDFMVKTIEETDFTDKAAQEKLEGTMKSLEDSFEAFYKEKGEDAQKAFDEAGKKASEKVNLEELMMKKVMEAVKAAGVDPTAAPTNEE